MKKKYIIIGLTILVFLMGLFVYLATTKQNNKNYIKEITLANLEEKLNNKESFVLVITQTGCGHCNSYKPILQSVGRKYDFTFYDINLTNLSKDEYALFTKIANSSGTPTTIFYENGEEKTTLNRLVGETSSKKLTDKLIKLKYIKK